MRGFILTTKGDIQSKIEYTFRLYDRNGDNKISGEEIQKMANVKYKYEKNDFIIMIRVCFLYLGDLASLRC